MLHQHLVCHQLRNVRQRHTQHNRKYTERNRSIKHQPHGIHHSPLESQRPSIHDGLIPARQLRRSLEKRGITVKRTPRKRASEFDRFALRQASQYSIFAHVLRHFLVRVGLEDVIEQGIADGAAEGADCGEQRDCCADKVFGARGGHNRDARQVDAADAEDCEGAQRNEDGRVGGGDGYLGGSEYGLVIVSRHFERLELEIGWRAYPS